MSFGDLAIEKIATGKLVLGCIFASEDQVAAQELFFIRVMLFHCPCFFPLDSLTFGLDKEKLGKVMVTGS